MKVCYYIMHPEEPKLYVYFDIDAQEFFSSDNLLDATTFNEKEGKTIIENYLDDEWKLIKITW